MMNGISLYAFGRCTVQGAWHIDHSRVVNRLYYVNGGRARVSNGFAEHELVVGKLYIIPQCHAFRPLDAQDFDHTFFDFYSTRILHHDRLITLEGDALFAGSLFDYINTLIAQGDGTPHGAMEAFLTGLLTVIEGSHSLPYIASAAITRAVNLIHAQCSAMNTGRLAKALNLDESYFVRLFSSVMGLSPMKYIRSCRISYGKELLQSGASVAEAAEKCGYASPTAFYNAVRAELHITPSELRNRG